jgi:hypothetical protein
MSLRAADHQSSYRVGGPLRLSYGIGPARASWLSASFAACLVLAGCASGFASVAPAPPAEFQKLGAATGTACGTLGVLATAYYFVPMGLNGRVERAYQNALQSVPGATALVNVSMSENWYWALVGTVRCVTISGEAIR